MKEPGMQVPKSGFGAALEQEKFHFGAVKPCFGAVKILFWSRKKLSSFILVIKNKMNKYSNYTISLTF